MTKSFFTLLLLSGALLLTACSASSTARSSTENVIEVQQVRIDPATQGEDSVVTFAMHYQSSIGDNLIGASSDAANAIRLRYGTGVVDAVPLYESLELNFELTWYHILLVDLKQDLPIGDEIEIILHFREHEDLTIKVPVQEVAE